MLDGITASQDLLRTAQRQSEDAVAVAAVATLAGLSCGRESIDIFGGAEGDETSLDDLRRTLIGYGFAVPYA